jgi:hypothetical protein
VLRACPVLAAPLLHGRLDVLVQVKEVGGIIPLLEGHQSLVVDAVGRSDAFLPFIAQEVDIDTEASKRSGGCPERTRPLHMLLRLVVGPRREHAQDVRLLPLGKSRPCTGYLGYPFENRQLEGTASGISIEDDRVFGGIEAARRTLALSGARS